MPDNPSPLPFLDARIEYIGIRGMKSLNIKALRELETVLLVIGNENQPLAVIVPYEKYLKGQDIIASLWLNTIDLLNAARGEVKTC